MATLKNEPKWPDGAPDPVMHDVIHGMRFYRDLSSVAQTAVLREELGDYNEETLERFSTLGFSRRLIKNGYRPFPPKSQATYETHELAFTNWITTHECEATKDTTGSTVSGSKRSVHQATKLIAEKLFEEIESRLLTQTETDWTKFLLQHEAKPAYLKHLDAIFNEEAKNYDAGIDFFEPVRACYAEFKQFFKKRGRKPRSDKGHPRGKRAEKTPVVEASKAVASNRKQLPSVHAPVVRARKGATAGKKTVQKRQQPKTRDGLLPAVKAIKEKPAPKKKRKTRSDKGKKRGPRKK